VKKIALDLFPVFILCLLVSTCGFHLRGSVDFQFSNIYIQSDSAKRIAKSVEELLLDEKVTLADSPDNAEIIIHLEHEKFERRGQAISAVSGYLEEVELSLQVNMKVLKSDGTVLQENQSIELIRNHSFDEKAVLAKGIEEETIREELLNDIVAQIMRRLRSVKINPNNSKQ